MELSNETFLHGAKYKILSKISQGNFGIIYLAEQTSLVRKVCIKEFFFRGFCERNSDGSVTISTSGQQVANSFRHKFMREAKRLSEFDHPNIVKVHDVFEENGTAYMVMDFVEGETLQQLVDRKGKLSEKEALEYIIPLCDALEVVHEKGLLHLDIKPSNILIKKQTNTPVLIDFGISKFTEASGDDHSTTAPVALTKGYAPLEQYGQDLAKLTISTDVYSVAATLYKLVTGITPPEAAVIVQDGIKSPKELNPTLSEQLSSIILQSLSVKPDCRAQSISKLKADLMGISKPVVVLETEGDTKVLHYQVEDEKNKLAVVHKTEEATEVLIEIQNPEPQKPDKLGASEYKSPVSDNSIGLWLLFAAVMIVIIIFWAISYYSASNSGNEAGITGTAVNNKQNQYDIVSSFSDGLAAVRKNNKWGFVDYYYALVIPLIYDEVGDFKEGKAIVKLNGTRIEIDKNGNEIKRVVKNNQPIVNGDNISSQATTNHQTIIYDNPVTDIDGNVYKTVRIGKQVWMAENLKVTHYRNGDEIPNVMDNTEWANLSKGGWCNYDNNVAKGAKYGKLYNWLAATDTRFIAPKGWHVPNKTDWTALINYLGGEDVAGGKLKEGGFKHWNRPNAGATNESGFTALAGGSRSLYTSYYLGIIGGWWCSIEDNTSNAFYCLIQYGESLATCRGSMEKGTGFSVRCIKD